MKTRNLSFAAAALSICMLAVSCEGLGNLIGPGTGENNGNNEENEGDKVVETLQPDEQKVKLENVALKLMDKCPADDFENYVNLVNRFGETYLENEDYDFSVFDTYGDQIEDASYSEQKWVEKFDAAKNMYVRERIINLTIMLSNYKGSFEFGKNGVQKLSDSGDGLKVAFPLDGKSYVAEIVPSAKTSRATFEYMEKYYWTETNWEYIEKPVYDQNGELLYYDYEEKVERFLHYDDYLLKFSIDVPENIKMSIKENGKTMADINIDITQSYSAAGLNPTVDNFQTHTTVTLNNGFSLDIKEAKFDGASSKANYSMALMKDGQALVTSSASGDVAFEITKHEYDHSYDDNIHKGEYTFVEFTKGKNISAFVDIIGEIQVKGTCSNAMDLSDIIDSFYEAADQDDRTKMDRAMNNINSKLDLGVYYDGGSNRQASVEFEYEKHVYDYSYDGSDYHYHIVPVIVFEDNSRYAVEDYFTEKSFSSLIEKFESFGEGYSDLFGTIGLEKEDVEVPAYPY